MVDIHRPTYLDPLIFGKFGQSVQKLTNIKFSTIGNTLTELRNETVKTNKKYDSMLPEE